MKKIISEIIALAVTVTLVGAAVLNASDLYMPPRTQYGATWSMYEQEQKDSIDMLFLGSSLVYCDIIPAVIYENTGYTSYVMTGPVQTIPITYYYLKESLKTQSPSLVFVEITGMFFDQYSEYLKANIGYMPYNLNRFAATIVAASPDEMPGLLFPLYNYHHKWEEHGFKDYFSAREDDITDIFAGYTYLDKAEVQTGRYERDFSYQEKVFDKNLRYLRKIKDYCEKRGIALQFYIAPVCEYIPHSLMKILDEKLAETGPITYVDFNDFFDEIAADINADFYDSKHFNFTGAIKFSDFMSQYIEDNFSITKHNRDENLWNDRIEKYKQLLE